MLYRSCFRNAYVYVLRLSRAILLLNNGICYYLTSYAAHINVHISISSRRRRRPNLISLLRNGRKSPAVQVIIGLCKCTAAIMVWVLNRPRDILRGICGKTRGNAIEARLEVQTHFNQENAIAISLKL